MLGLILGSAFSGPDPGARLGLTLRPETVATPVGDWTLHHVEGDAEGRALRADGVGGVVSLRHGTPHRFLPNQIPYRAQAWAMRAAGAESVLVTSSVGVMTERLPLYQPILLSDILYPENRLPDGSACTLFPAPTAEQGHLVLSDGLLSERLGDEIARVADRAGVEIARGAVFAYAGGPRGKTAAENAMWARLGAEVNSMTLAPEAVLAAEGGASVAGLVVGHKYSVPGRQNPDEGGIAASLDASREATRSIARAYLESARPIQSGNHLYRFDSE